MNKKIVGIIVVLLLSTITAISSIGNEKILINAKSENLNLDDNVIITNLTNSWNFVSLPFNQSVNKNDLNITYDNVDYNWNDAVSAGYVNNYIFGWNRTGQYYTFATVLEPGYGYWIYANGNCEMWASNISVNSDDYITDIALYWNIIGIPSNLTITNMYLILKYDGINYPWPHAISSGIINPYVFGWDRSGQFYTFSDMFEPGYCYWMFVYLGCSLLYTDVFPEICDDGIDNDDDTLIDCLDPDCFVDIDGDGYYAPPCGDDCNDINYEINPGAIEVCNGIDDDCDMEIDEGEDNPGCTNYYLDQDNDGYGDDNYPVRCLCGPDHSTGYTATQGGDCDDSVSTVFPGATEVCNGIDDDCDMEIDEGIDCNPEVGDIIITEMMINPDAVPDSNGEWIEIYNAGSQSYNLNGCSISDYGTNYYLIIEEFIINPGEHIVLCNNEDYGTNGGVICDIEYTNFNLNNADDEVVFKSSDNTIIDEVIYDSNWVFIGSSIQLDINNYDYISNDDIGNWCESIDILPGGDYGTPGVINNLC